MKYRIVEVIGDGFIIECRIMRWTPWFQCSDYTYSSADDAKNAILSWQKLRRVIAHY